MQPRIMLMRHAEKARGEAEEEQGISPSGHPNADSLSVRGWQRAGALVRLFDPLDESSARPRLSRPTALFAARSTPTHTSTRPRDTLLPLSAALSLEIDEQFGDDDPPGQVARALLALDAPVLVCWRHDLLPALAKELLRQEELVPPRWPEDRFDVVWVIGTGQGARTFWQVPQRVLGGDRMQGIARRVRTAARRNAPAARPLIHRI